MFGTTGVDHRDDAVGAVDAVDPRVEAERAAAADDLDGVVAPDLVAPDAEAVCGDAGDLHRAVVARVDAGHLVAFDLGDR